MLARSRMELVIRSRNITYEWIRQEDKEKAGILPTKWTVMSLVDWEKIGMRRGATFRNSI